MADINLPAMLAQRLRDAAGQLRDAAAKMPAERLTWNPEVDSNKGRDALDQVLECAYINALGAKAYQTSTMPDWDNDDYKAQTDAHRTPETAAQWLQESTEALAATIAGMPVDQLATVVRHPFYPKDVTLAELTDLFYWNMVYHIGQLNYIQVLYGDNS